MVETACETVPEMCSVSVWKEMVEEEEEVEEEE